MNKNIVLPILFGMTFTFSLNPYQAHASQSWHSFCSNISSNSSQLGTNSLTADNYVVQASDNPTVKMITKELTVNKNNLDLSNDQFQRITNVTSTGILAIVLNHQMKDCNKQYYSDTFKPLLDNSKDNEKINFTWRNVTLRNNKISYKISQIFMQITKQGNNVNAQVRFSGLVTSPQYSKNSAFIPTQGDVNFTTTAQTFPILLAATSSSNKATNSQIPVTINNLVVSNALSTITANGTVELNNKARLKAAKGVITIRDMQALIDASSNIKNTKLKTGLILAKFAGTSAGDNVLKWNIQWQGNLFKVNNVPIPIW
ncbi:hypothetical protein [Commensalibacter oyaizuii]|uniref:DUF2125 domain-containing protein n=1 Tax=Commensalibacter oyaizuii TaxID=3043873 RepID=A0ABT6Q044_9PROT|nr:hypothetical protein [Commensalibacter sp. TBRC 16381]MDI2090473.1 hypothetical protein [Commensalibacter sp. TBRC 16381]